MKIIGSAKNHLMPSNSQEAGVSTDNPEVAPQNISEIICAAAMDGNSSSKRVGSEYYFNSQTPYMPTRSDAERAVEQVLVHVFGADEPGINRVLDRDRKAVGFLKERIEVSNENTLMIEKGLRDRQIMDIAQSMEEKRQAVVNIVKQNESGDSRDFF